MGWADLTRAITLMERLPAWLVEVIEVLCNAINALMPDLGGGMPTYYDGLTDGQRFSNSLQTAAEGADAVRGLFRGRAPSLADEARALKAELLEERGMRSLARATVAGMEAAISELPPEHRAALQAAMERTFDAVFVKRAGELGVTDAQPGQLANFATETRRSLLRR